MKTSRRNAAATIFAGSSINSLIIAIQALVLIPLYLKFIGPHLYGAWLGSSNVLVWLLALDLGLPNYMIQRIGASHGRGDEKTIGEYFFSGIFLLFIIAVLVVLIGIGISSIIPGLLGITGSEAATLGYCFILGSIAQAINLFNNGIVALSRGIQKTLYVNIVEISSSLLGFLTTFILIVKDYGLWSIAVGLLIRALAQLIGNVIFSVYNFRGTSKGFLRLKRSRVKEFLAISPATTLGEISHAVRNNSDVALVAFVISPEIATVLSLTKKALQIIQSFVDMISFAVYGSFANLL
ncbi:oligosaccharide flippase family protein, partial [bacterium]|nr:oligosaccharide flippase family protein [bacterium]